jgi:hypothetical protein
MRECRKDLSVLNQAGIPHRALVTLLALTAKRRMELSEETKKAFRHRRTEAKKLAKRFDILASGTRAFAGYPQHLNVLSESMRKNSSDIENLLSRKGRKLPDLADQGMAILLRVIRRCNQTFDRWEPLSRVLATAFLAAGIHENQTKHLTGDMLRKRVECMEHVQTGKGE